MAVNPLRINRKRKASALEEKPLVIPGAAAAAVAAAVATSPPLAAAAALSIANDEPVEQDAAPAAAAGAGAGAYASAAAQALASAQCSVLEKELLTQRAKLEYEKNIKALQDVLHDPKFEDLKNVKETFDGFNQSLEKLNSGVTREVGKFLDYEELETSSKLMPFLFTSCKSDMEERKRVTEALLPHIFNAQPKAIESFFSKTENMAQLKLILVKSPYHEGYFSEKLDEFVCFRRWRGVSPLQAAYLCGDGRFLGRQLLAYIIKDNMLSDEVKDRLLKEAREQLQELVKRIPNVAEQANTNNSAVTTAAKAAATAAPATTVVSSSNAAGNKEKAELPVATNAENKFADFAEFLAPLKDLIQAYRNYLSQCNLIASKDVWTEKESFELDRLWGKAGECHKRLPRYVLQEFFGPAPFEPLPDFTKPPPRGECRYRKNDLLNLDELGLNTFTALYKAWCAGTSRCVSGEAATWRELDLLAISHLYERRVADLRNTVDCLQSLKSARELIDDTNPIADKKATLPRAGL